LIANIEEAALSTNTMPLRSEIAKKHTWDDKSVFETIEAFEAAVKEAKTMMPALKKFEGRLSEGPSVLADCLDQVDKIRAITGRIGTYVSMEYSVDTTDMDAAARGDRARGLQAAAQSAGAFIAPELLNLEAGTLQQWVAQEPRLSHLGLYVEQLEKRREHIRSAEVEALLSQASDVFNTASRTHGVMSDADLVFEPAKGSDGQTYEIGQGTIGTLLSHADREIRRTAYENYANVYLANKNSMANCISAGMKRDVFTARARNYESSLDAALSPNHLPQEVFHNLIDTFKKNLPTWHKYWSVRKKALGLDVMKVYDGKGPLTGTVTPVPYDQAVDWISEGMKPLGDAYVTQMRSGATDQRWVDIYPNKGKRMGAFSTGVQGVRPFIMMSYDDTMFGLSTLAHELGHSMHSYLAWENQPKVYSGYTMFVAEVASNFNQALVRDHLLKTQTDAEFQIQIIEEAMANFHRYFFIMPTLARFELEIHERVERGEALTANTLIALMADLFAEGYGDGVEINREQVGITWAQFATHLYANFYVFQYATGISAANALANRVLDQGQSAAEDYLKFLSAGSSLYPLEALKVAGVDMTESTAVEAAFGVLADYVNRLESLVN
jgi:oligoendopeptidase F